MTSDARPAGRFLFLLLSLVPHVCFSSEPVELNLSRFLDMVIAESQDIRDGEFSLSAAEIQRRLALQSYFPTLSMSYSDVNSVVYGGSDSENTSVRLTLSQPIYNGGRVAAARRLQGVEIERSRDELIVLADELRVSGFSAYFEYLILELKITHQEEILSIAEEQVRISRAEFDLGRIREVDLLETELEVQAMAQGLEDQRIALDEAAYTLRRMLGLDPEQEFKIANELPEDYFGIELALEREQLVEMALRSNSQMRSSLLDLEESDIEYRSVRSQWLPDISVDASVSLSGAGFPMQESDYDITINIDIPLPWVPISGSFSLNNSPRNNYGNTRSVGADGPDELGYLVNKRLAALALENALESYDSLREDLRFQVGNAFDQYSGMCKTMKMSDEQVKLQEQLLLILSKEVELGTSTRLDYVTAQNEYIEQVLSLLEGRLELLNTERALETLLGIPFGSLGELGVGS